MFNELSKSIEKDLGSATSPASARMLQRYKKKFNTSSTDFTRNVALEKFKEDIQRVASFDIVLTPDEISDARHFIYETLTSGARRVNTRFNTTHWPQQIVPYDIFRHPDFLGFGKGASASSSLSHILDKLVTKKVSYTESVLPLVPYLKVYSREFYSCITSDFQSYTRCEGSRITTVPKDNKTDRVIACEPTINMWFQLAFGRFIEESLTSVGLNIRTQQPKNQEYAKRGSRFCEQWSDPFCTIDLSSASDSISMELLEKLYPQEFVDVIQMLRSPSASVNNEVYTLPMVSTMGNGFTFPLLTLTCAAIVYAANEKCRGGHLNWRNTAIFGDDIIVKRSVYNKTCDLLVRAGFLVNNNKSYCSGLFRESCGGDYYDGEFITPFYITDLATNVDIRIALNQAIEWSTRHHLLVSTIELLKSKLSKADRPLVPMCFSYESGILFPTTEKRSKVTFFQRCVKGKKFSGRSGFKSWAYLAGFLTSTCSSKVLKESLLDRSDSESDCFAFSDCYITRESSFTYKTRGFAYPFPWDTLQETRPSEWWDRPKYVPSGYTFTRYHKRRWASIVSLLISS